MLKRLVSAWSSVILLGHTYSAALAAAPERAWMPADSIGVRYFASNQQYPGWFSGKAEAPAPSPDGRYCFFVTRHGDLSTDSNVYELWVFSADDIERALGDDREGSKAVAQPLRRIAFRSRSNEPGIKAARWREDSAAIEFLGMSEEGRRQVHRLSLPAGQLARLTDGRQDVMFFETQGAVVSYQAALEPEPVAPKTYPSAVFGKYDFNSLLAYSSAFRFGTYVSTGAGMDREVGAPSTMVPTPSPPAISPDGRLAIGQFFLTERPQLWDQYDGPAGDDPEQLAYYPQLRFSRLMMVDVETGEKTAVFDAPIGSVTRMGADGSLMPGAAQAYPEAPLLRLYAGIINVKPRALWWEDSRHVILVNTALPIASSPQNRNHAYIVAYDTKSRRWSVLEPMQVTLDGKRRWVSSVDWLEPGRALRVEHKGDSAVPQGATLYRRRGNRWVSQQLGTAPAPSKSRSANLKGGIQVEIRESADSAPVAVASRADRSVPLTPPDPALEAIRRAPVEAISWQEPGGKTERGLLMLPRDRKASQRLPLVINAYHADAELFRPDGPYPTAYAAQTLVAQGFAVLSVSIYGLGRDFSEGQNFVKRLDAAVDELSRKGIVDESRVGLVGFSRGGFVTLYALTHPGKTRIRAAIDADGWYGSYVEYLMGNLMGAGMEGGSYESYFGGGTFWQNKTSWLEHAPGFNVDRVTTPLLHIVNGPHLLLATEIFAAFQLNRKPFELLVFPEAVHQLQRPRERLTSLQITGDWMTFWLQDQWTSDDPDREARFRRWRRMLGCEPAGRQGSCRAAAGAMPQ